MYLHRQTIKYPVDGYKHLLIVTPVRHLNLLEAIIDAVEEHWARNNAVFRGSQEVDFLAAVQDVPDDVCAAHGFYIIKSKYRHDIEAEREPQYNKLRTN